MLPPPPPPPPQLQPVAPGDYHRGQPPLPPQMMRQPSAASSTLHPDFPQPGGGPHFDAYGDSYASKRTRKLAQRRTVDYTSTIIRYIQARMWQKDVADRPALQPSPAAVLDMLPPIAYPDNPSTSFPARFVHASTNKNRCSINRVVWFPTGRRLITGSQNGELTLWNGQSFNFEMILQAHDTAIRSMVWSNNENWMVSGDDGGTIKYWQSSMNNVKANKTAHKESVRGLSFCRTDLKFCSCSDDTTVKIWDFARFQDEKSLTGHGSDVKSVDWHPANSLIASGAKDNLVKLWDARTGKELSSFYGHKNMVLCVKWNQNGNWVLTSSKDQIIKLYDIRTMKEMESFRGHKRDVNTLAWHPFHEEYFASGSADGSIFHWVVGHESPQVEIAAHESGVLDLAWHPVGYLLCSGSNDHTTKFWCRHRPGDSISDRYSGCQVQGYADQNVNMAGRMMGGVPGPDGTPFSGGLSQNEGTIPGIGLAMPLAFQSLDGSEQEGQRPSIPGLPSGPPPLPPGPHPSLLASGQQQQYQQMPPQHLSQQQHQQFSQQLPSMPPRPPNLQSLQPPSHLPLVSHPHGPRPPMQQPPFGIPQTIPSSLQGSLPLQVPMNPPLPPGPNPMAMQNSMSTLISPLTQHLINMNQMHSGAVPPSNLSSIGGFQNVQGASGLQSYPHGSMFNQPQGQALPGLNSYQPSINMGHPPAPLMPPPHGSQQQ